jgi:hypothetical protein
MCPRGDLNTETGEISPDRGNHAIRVTRPGRMYPAIPLRVRYLACCLAERQERDACFRAGDRRVLQVLGQLGCAGRSAPPSVKSGATPTLK